MVSYPKLFPHLFRLKVAMTATAFFSWVPAVFLFSLWKPKSGNVFFVCIQCAIVYKTFPFSLNHFGWEILLLLLLFEKSLKEFKLAFVFLWIFTGIQKIFHGEFLGGEFFISEMINNYSSMGNILRSVFQENFTLPCCQESLILYRPMTFFMVKILSIGVVLSEIFLPLLVVWKNKFWIFWLIMILIIGIFSKEWDFALTNFLCVFLFWSKNEN